MPVNPTYPGLYIEEVPSSARTITPAPTSIAVFVGYTHPFKTLQFNTAVNIFSFTEYERAFGGMFESVAIDRQLAFGVNQFFLNGGSVAVVVGLEAVLHDAASGDALGPLVPAKGPIGSSNIELEAREPTDAAPITVTVTNVNAVDPNIADLQITYGRVAETYRAVNSADAVNRINANSTLVTASGTGGGPFTKDVGVVLKTTILPGTTTFNPNDYINVFADDSSLDKVDIFNLLVLPGVTDNSVWSTAQDFCEKKRAFAILDPPANSTADGMGRDLPEILDDIESVPKSTNGALYFPYQRTTDPLSGQEIQLAPSGYVAGIYARTDNNRGVWKAPAGLETVLRNTLGGVEEGLMTDMRQGLLNPEGVNCLRAFRGVGTVVFGARTLVTRNTAHLQWRYVPVRRTALFIEQTLVRNLGWVVFEPNYEPLWVAIRTSIEGFMLSLFRQGAFQGSKPSDAFLVQCDASTTTQTDIDNGIVNIVVGFRPLKPAEFVIIKISQLAGQAQA